MGVPSRVSPLTHTETLQLAAVKKRSDVFKWFLKTPSGLNLRIPFICLILTYHLTYKMELIILLGFEAIKSIKVKRRIAGFNIRVLRFKSMLKELKRKD